MICVIPFCYKDVHLALENLRWICELGGCPNHDCLLVADAGTQWGDCLEALTLANEAFRKAQIITTPQPVDDWIRGANALFKEAAIWAQTHGTPWFFLEPDAIPLKPGWLDQIDKAYSECGTLFMGPLVKHQTAGYPSPYLEGISCYPPDCWTRFAEVWDDAKCWCFACASISVPQCVNTPLVQQLWGDMGIATSFVPFLTIHSQPQDKTLAHLSPNAVVYHRSKDNSLPRLLRGKLFKDSPDYMQPPTFVQLGRIGDLILLLPAFKAWSDRSGTKTRVVTSREFGSVLEGASYVQVILLNYTWFEAGKARDWANARFPNVIVTQLHGSDIPTVPDDLKSYSLSMWKRTGLLEEYETLPLVFDQRHPDRERVLFQSHVEGHKPIILTKFEGWTSPFEGGPAITKRLGFWADKFQFINLDRIQAQRVYDLLVFFDKAAGLITGDSFPIHLAPASDVQYIAYTRDDGQSGSIPKGNCVLQIGYSQWQQQMEAFDLQLELWTKRPKPI